MTGGGVATRVDAASQCERTPAAAVLDKGGARMSHRSVPSASESPMSDPILTPDDEARQAAPDVLRAENARLRDVLITEHSYWQVRSLLARTGTEQIMADWHLDLIEGALAGTQL